MTRYRVRHGTSYEYAADVVYSRLVTHLAPRTTSRQAVESVDVRVTPVSSEHAERSDFFGNRTDWFVIGEPHVALEVVAESLVTVEPVPAFDVESSAPWEAVRKTCEISTDAAVRDATQYAFDTPLTITNQDVVDFALESFAPGRPLLASICELNSRIHRDFKYDTTATDAGTAVDRVFELRAGVCQDFAHAAIAAVRSMGLPARYVSGYLLTHPPPGRERLVGADASHAWFAVWIPPFGWIDFDPTNDMLPSNEHITVAWGRDYTDVAPVHGIITGGSEHRIDVSVDVQPLV